MSAIKFRKCFSKFIALQKFGCLTFISRVEVRNIIAASSKPNKLRNVYNIRSTARNVTIQKRKIIINFRKKKKHKKNSFVIERCKSKKGDSVSVVLALFNHVVQVDKFD